jgi:hypothetical protein
MAELNYSTMVVHGNGLRVTDVLSRYFPEETVESHEYTVNPPGFEMSTFLIKVRSVTATPARSIYCIPDIITLYWSIFI